MQSYCGDSPLWDREALLESSWPHVTQCLQDTVLTLAPCGWLWLTCAPHLVYLRRHRSYVLLAPSPLCRAKAITSLVLVLLSLVHIAILLIDKTEHPPTSSIVSKTLWAGSFVLCWSLILVSQRWGVHSPCIVFIFWTFALIVSVIPVYSGFILKGYDQNMAGFCVECLSLFLTIIEFVLQCCNETKIVSYHHRSSFKTPCPEGAASFPSKLIYSWAFRQIYIGFRKTVTLRDVSDMPPSLYSHNNITDFLDIWNDETERLRVKFHNPAVNPYQALYEINSCNEDDEEEDSDDEGTTSLLRRNRGRHSSQLNKRRSTTPSLFKALWKLYWLPYAKAQMIGLLADVLNFANTLLLEAVIHYVQYKDEYPKWQGFFFATSFMITTLVCAMLTNHKVYKTWYIGMQIKSTLMAAVYKKALTMNAESRRKFTVGTIVNLMAVDCAKFLDLILASWVIFSAPVVFTISFYLLYKILGLAFISGLAIMVGILPVVTKIASMIKKVQAEQLKVKDTRIKLMNEILSGIKVLKLSAWELSMEEQVANLRDLELRQLWKKAIYLSLSTWFWFVTPVMVIVLTFVTFTVVASGALTPSRAFVSMNIFNFLRIPINVLPQLITQLAQVRVSVKRLEDFLSGEDLVEVDTAGGDENHPVVMEDATFRWDRKKEPTLKGLNVEVAEGSLVAVVGQVGAGKSSLLAALLGEMSRLDGHMSVRGSIAYVPQQAWIQNLTLRDNILFGRPMDEERYQAVITACALWPDIELLPGGELTEIGEKGINLSGGQKQRLSLARAVYSDADLYFLDDPLSAVDSQVGRHIFDHLLGPQGLLRNKTRILVTHGIHWLPQVDHIYVMENGCITETGTYQNLMDHNGPFANFVQTYLLEHAKETSEEEHEDDSSMTDSRIDIRPGLGSTRSQSSESRQHTGSPRSEGEDQGQSRDRLIKEETSATGRVSLSVLQAMVKAFGPLFACLVPLCLVFYQGLNVFSGIWLADWTDDNFLRNVTNSGTAHYKDKTYMYLGIFAAINVTLVLGNGVFILLVFTRFVHASRRLHHDMLANILRQAMMFFDTTPMGRILNRFSRDIEIVDNVLPHLVRISLHNLFQLIAIITIISYSTPIFIAVAVPIFVIYFFLQNFYIPSSRQYQRLVSTTRSPIYSHFSESISGASTIRAYRARDRFSCHSQHLIDINSTCAFTANSSARWLRLRLEMLGSVIGFSAALFAILYGGVSGGTVGLSITFALQVTSALNMLILNATLLETNSVSVERMVEYIRLPQEPAWVEPDSRPESSWPERGQITFDNFSARYRPTLQPVLTDLSFHVKAGEKVGIVGRTGAGKSSLSMGLFRVLEACQGCITVDGLDISTIGLHDLRSRLTILPQDPVLFSGTVRLNLDPFEDHTDQEVWEALENAHLKSFFEDKPDGLAFRCEEGGQNLSVGQRQLLCLARAMLRKSPVLVLDEATAAVDLESDSIIQRSIRDAFRDCTVLTVAHRLNTIIDYDRILVLDKGRIVEFDEPEILLADREGMFYSMAKEAGLVDPGKQ